MIPWLLPSNQARFSYLVFALNDSLIVTLESSKITTSGLCCKWFPDCYPKIKISTPGLYCEWSIDFYPRIEQDTHNWTLLWMVPWLLPSNRVRFSHLVSAENYSLIASLESSKISTHGICCDWFPDCFWIKQDFHTLSLLWMIPWLLPSNEARFSQLVSALNEFLVATVESSKNSTSGIFCEWFPDCYPRTRIAQLAFAVNDSLIATFELR